ncbi:MAG: 1-deoxy-D-xylulose-5-phosphate synthase N-terminal domain-containing protein [Oscillospiraceae bacterium]
MERIQGREDWPRLGRAEQTQLCEESRPVYWCPMPNWRRQVAHLASNLGVVELSVALETVFDTRTDRLVSDVGHRSYIHKILTDRRDRLLSCGVWRHRRFSSNSCESVTDAFVAGRLPPILGRC